KAPANVVAPAFVQSLAVRAIQRVCPHKRLQLAEPPSKDHHAHGLPLAARVPERSIQPGYLQAARIVARAPNTSQLARSRTDVQFVCRGHSSPQSAAFLTPICVFLTRTVASSPAT